jgi:hypothetical protein
MPPSSILAAARRTAWPLPLLIATKMAAPFSMLCASGVHRSRRTTLSSSFQGCSRPTESAKSLATDTEGHGRANGSGHGIEYAPSEKSKSDMYRDLLPLLNSRKTELLDLPRLATQLTGLERRTARGGRDSIDHPPGSYDDIANCRPLGHCDR